MVDTSSTGAEILCLIEPAANCFVVMLRCGSGADISGILDRFVVKARARDIFSDVSLNVPSDIWPGVAPNMSYGQREIFGVGGQFRLDRARVYGGRSNHMHKDPPPALFNWQVIKTLCFFTAVLFRNQARCNVLVLKSEYQPELPLVWRLFAR